jgi:hypothetical protein
MKGIEILTDGRTVWVNADPGICIGRFSRLGAEVHNDFEAMTQGGKECLERWHGRMTTKHWVRWVSSMRRHYGIDIGNEYAPRFLNAF